MINETVDYSSHETGETNNNYKILIVGDPDVTISFLKNIASNKIQSDMKSKFRSVHMEFEDMRFELWYCNEMDYTEEERMESFHDALGVIALFAVGDKNSFKYVPHCISEVINHSSKMLPTFVLGVKNKKNLEKITREDVLEYLYTLGNSSACMIPYVEISKSVSTNFIDILLDLVKIINCNKKENCYNKPAILRGKCGLKQFEVKS